MWWFASCTRQLFSLRVKAGQARKSNSTYRTDEGGIPCPFISRLTKRRATAFGLCRVTRQRGVVMSEHQRMEKFHKSFWISFMTDLRGYLSDFSWKLVPTIPAQPQNELG